MSQAVSPPPAQQVSPRLPQLTQLPPEQRAPEAVQVIAPPPNPPPAPPAPEPPQQVCPTAPQVTPVLVLHDPFEQVPLVPEPMHVEPLPMHVPPMQQPPDWQLFAAQQACPAVPQLCAPVPPTVDDELPPHDGSASAAHTRRRTSGLQARSISERRIIVCPPAGR